MNTLSCFSRLGLLWCLLLLAGCVDPYMPDVLTAPPNYLVVDGFINSQGVTTIRLSRSYAVASADAPTVEADASLYIEEEAGARFPLQESTSGTYTSPPLTLDVTKRYRLHISTLAGQQYASDFVPVKTTPPIDNVSWRTPSTGLDILVNSHDDTNNTRYYRWEYEETWEINPPYSPTVEYVNGAMRDIVVLYPTLCWGNARSTRIQIDNTTALNRDVVANYRIRLLPTTSELLRSRYSILVQQHALTKEEYTYWELLRKNTENIGSLFDPQPSQVSGNVKCLTNADEIALGFVGAHSVTEKRIFIRRADLPVTWRVRDGYESCQPPDTVDIIRDRISPAQILASAFTSRAGALPIDPIYSQGVLRGYTAKSADCIDCRKRGTSVKPSFWP